MACPTPSMPQASAPASQNDRLERTSNIAGRKTKRSSPGLFLVDSRRGCPRHATRQIPFEIIQVPHGNHNAICKTGTRGLLAVVSHTTGNLRASPPLPVRVARASHEKEMDKIEGAPVAVLVVRGSMSLVDKRIVLKPRQAVEPYRYPNGGDGRRLRSQTRPLPCQIRGKTSTTL